ncbi:hypothetical protein DM860_010435 [Cuscuta australis]|uniref:Uncharacterized protein n=1 Tax=Cuscuta australis TaxID=267555 RepID=A0A328E1G6_9ASTE|nr:hypothetical protein DM860_010435 [Cuscuta australis]
MRLELRNQTPVSSSSINRLVTSHYSDRRVVVLDTLIFNRCNTRMKSSIKLSWLVAESFDCSHRFPGLREHWKLRRKGYCFPYVSADDGVTVDESLEPSTSAGVEEMRANHVLPVESEEDSRGLVQALHDAARVIELGIRQHNSSRKPWFLIGWPGVDRTAWVKVISYQASIYSLLQAVNQVSSQGDGSGRDINTFIQRSISKLSAPLESVINNKLLANQQEIFEWFWSEQIPAVVTTFVNYFQREKSFTSSTAASRSGISSTRNAYHVQLLMLALSCIEAIIKLGPVKVSCEQFFSSIPETLGRLMDMLVENLPLQQAYQSLKTTGLHREFLVHFGPRAAACIGRNEQGAEEAVFWVDLVQKQLQRAIDQERIWSRLTTSESIEILEKDLAIFGFFIALGRTTQCFLSANGFDAMDKTLEGLEPIERLIRYLIGGSVLYYPQLSSISSYQLYVEVVCEELEWLPFYPGFNSNSKCKSGHKIDEELPNAEAVLLVFDVCSYWIQSFIKYSRWLGSTSNIKAARFVSTAHNILHKCVRELGIEKSSTGAYSRTGKEQDSFDKAMESVEEALIRLEGLLQELHVSTPGSGKEHLKAACSDLERIRRLKKEAEFLEASFRAKEASLEQGDAAASSSPLINESRQCSEDKNSTRTNNTSNMASALRGFLLRKPNKARDDPSSSATRSDDGRVEHGAAENNGTIVSKSDDFRRYETLQSELVELERRVQESTDHDEDEDEMIQMVAEKAKLVRNKKKESIIGNSLDKLKETSTDVWEGTQLLAIDVAAATELLAKTVIRHDELTEKEKQALKRTLTDLASVVPIGFLMLLPVTAVGHAAMLAAIQRYVPALIPSTYGPERLALLRQLKKMKEMEAEATPIEEMQ